MQELVESDDWFPDNIVVRQPNKHPNVDTHTYSDNSDEYVSSRPDNLSA